MVINLAKTMPVKILLYGWVGEKIGKKELDGEAGHIKKVLFSIDPELPEKFKEGQVMVVANHSLKVDENYVVKEGDVLAILPLPSGG